MSDYLFTTQKGMSATLAESIQKVYMGYDIECKEYTGEWGSLSVSPSTYRGFQPFESDSHICVVLGGPVLYFRNNQFVTEENQTAGTEALLERFLAGTLDLKQDVSGPFQLLIIDKVRNRVTCITDLMLFIPAYQCERESEFIVGSHVDAVARVTGEIAGDLDGAAIVDFILHGVVTFPHTVYKHILQLHPATYYEYSCGSKVQVTTSKPYWLPREDCAFTTISEAAKDLREGMSKHINAITSSMTHVAQFISGGEDSRALSGLLPERLKRDAFVFLDSMNKEGRIAEKVAHAYAATFNMGKRDPLHYVDIIDEAAALVGSGHEYMHCHSLRFDKGFELGKYVGVFGGYLSDSLLKANYARKSQFGARLGFLPEKWLIGEERSKPLESDVFSDDILNVITARRQAHLTRVSTIRKESAHEWFVLWPATMRRTIPNHYCNRRLFASYEVFMSHEVVRVGASVPTTWKLNRKLFHSAFQSCLAKSKWTRHSDGRLPYFNASVNMPMLFINFLQRVSKRLRGESSNDGAWNSWAEVQASDEWKLLAAKGNEKLDSMQIFKPGQGVRAEEKLARNLTNISRCEALCDKGT